MSIQIGTPFTTKTQEEMTEKDKLLYKSFFDEARDLLKNQGNMNSEEGDVPIPTDSLQAKYENILKVGGGHFCFVRQIAKRFAFREPQVQTILH